MIRLSLFYIFCVTTDVTMATTMGTTTDLTMGTTTDLTMGTTTDLKMGKTTDLTMGTTMATTSDVTMAQDCTGQKFTPRAAQYSRRHGLDRLNVIHHGEDEDRNNPKCANDTGINGVAF